MVIGRRLIKEKQLNGIPAFAGMTVIIESLILKKHRHARAGGHPIWFSNMGKSQGKK